MDFGTNPCAEIVLGDGPKECSLPYAEKEEIEIDKDYVPSQETMDKIRKAMQERVMPKKNAGWWMNTDDEEYTPW